MEFGGSTRDEVILVPLLLCSKSKTSTTNRLTWVKGARTRGHLGILLLGWGFGYSENRPTEVGRGWRGRGVRPTTQITNLYFVSQVS